MPDKKPVAFDAVYQREMQEILKRRREANIPIEKDEAGNPKSPAADLVGLALSGGGVRSGAFNLGLLQSLHQNGVLRHVDYMSTISGGGYVGASLSSLALHPDTEFEWKANTSNEGGKESAVASNQLDKFPLNPHKDGRQPTRVLEFIHGGNYLRRPLIFLNRYLIGVILTNLVAVSLVFAVAALAAWLFRCLDHTWSMDWLFALGFQGDVARALFPTAFGFFVWIVMWGISYWRNGSQAEGQVARWFLTFTIVSFLLAVGVLVGTGDVSLTHIRDTYGVAPPTDIVNAVTGNLKTYFLLALALALLPYLRISDLIRSGTRPRTAVEGWIFGIASRALLYGIPLVIFSWFARENLSHFNENRQRREFGVTFNTQHDLTPLDFDDWAATWQEFKLQATDGSSPTPAAAVAEETATDSSSPRPVPASAEGSKFAVSKRVWSEVDKETVDRSFATLSGISEFDRETSFVRRWILYAGYLITRQPNPVTDQFERRQDFLSSRWKVCDALNAEILADPTFHESFQNVTETLPLEAPGMPPAEQQKRASIISALIADAELLELKARNTHAALLQKDPEAPDFNGWREERQQLLDDLRASTDRGAGGEADKLKRLALLMGQETGKEKNDLYDPYVELESELKSVNRQLLQAYWGERLKPMATVFALTVLEADQAERWSWFLWALTAFLASGLIVNVNATSLHGFYRNMLSKMWITEVPGFGRKIPLVNLETVAHGAPYHLIGATLHLLGRRRQTERSSTDVFIFSQGFCGSTRTGYMATKTYMNGSLDLSNAIALSGAAVTPTQVQNPLLAVLLMLSNSRLGQWLPNPGRYVALPTSLDYVMSWLPAAPLRLLFGVTQSAEKRNYCFVSDGGHHENLGIETLLLRRCRLVIASDVTCDRNYEFNDLVRLIRRMRFEYGIRITGLSEGERGVPLEDLTPAQIVKGCVDWEKSPVKIFTDENHAESHYFVGRIHYPADGPQGSPEDGYFIYLKPNYTGDEAIDLIRYQLENPAFPNDHTSDQFYDPQKFESYRQLGFHIGRTVCADLFPQCEPCSDQPITLSQWSPPTLDPAAAERPDNASPQPSGSSRARKTAK